MSCLQPTWWIANRKRKATDKIHRVPDCGHFMEHGVVKWPPVPATLDEIKHHEDCHDCRAR